jgi:hypothetical protein
MIDANYPAAIPVSAPLKWLPEQPRSELQVPGRRVVTYTLDSVGR